MDPSLSFASIILILVSVFIIKKTTSFIQNYVAAVRTGYPVFATPVFSKSIVWMLLAPVFQPQMKKWFPEWIYERIDIVINGWEFRLKDEMHARLGKVFVIATPDEVSIYAADPAVASTILQRRKDFQQPSIAKRIVDRFGPNVLSANGDDWQRQRRIVAPNLNERISETVWKEGCSQARAMLDYLEKNPGDQTVDGLRNIAINVLVHTCYGHSQPWSPESYNLDNNVQKGGLTYFQAISLVTVMILEAALLPSKLLKLPIMPRSLRLLGDAVENLPHFTKDLLDRERKASSELPGPRNNLLSMLVQLSDQGKREGGSGLSLSEEEISGNLFIFSAAGFDTTANTMGYAVTLLAAHPEWQDWIQEELQSLDIDISKWEYKETFPKCQRVLAVMFETLRLFTPALHSIREIYETQQITDSKGSHILNAPMTVYVSSQSIHSDPDIWGCDVSEFKPSRWIGSSGALITPPKGTFLPWSSGPRTCPGMKMAQVEFVATFATLFRSSKCRALSDAQESGEEIRKRLECVMVDSIPKMTLQIRDPKEVKLEWVPGGSGLGVIGEAR